MPHVLVLGSYAPSLFNFRGPLIAAMVEAGWRVSACAPGAAEGEAADAVRRLGATPVSVTLARTGMNPLSDLAYQRELVELFRELRPDVVLAYTAKPVIWGALAARQAGVPHMVGMITGLGYAFTPPARPNLKHAIAALSARLLYRLALKRADHVLFQNPDDRDLFLRLGLAPRPEKAGLIAGSGVDLERFPPQALPADLSFLMLARLLGAKGVREYAQAARRLKARYPQVDFRLAGGLDAGPDAVATRELQDWIAGGINYLGELEDVRPALAEAAVYVLPSYREGTPRSVLEAMATGRAIITTDAPGCRETVVDGVNGFLVTPRDAGALEAAMERFITQPDLAVEMGARSLEMARNKFDVRLVNAQVLDAIRRLTGQGRS